METVELDVALEELELRLERLRSLYEQYFLGLEKIEPSVARKDVDRRIYVLRREKIRNTAKRFKLQTIIQRYNTFQQYWQRICREIENGTYKRHLLRAQKTNGELLTIAARKRLGRAARTSQPAEAAPQSQPPSAPPSAPPEAAAAPPPAPAIAPARVVSIAPAAPGPAAPAAPRPAAPAAPRAVPPPKPAAAAKPAAPKFESLDLDMDFMGDWDPASRRGTPAKPSAPVVPARPAVAASPIVPVANRPAPVAAQPVAVPPRPASSPPPQPPAHPVVASPRIPPSPRIPLSATSSAARPAKPASSPIAAAPPKPAAMPPVAAAPPKPAAAAPPTPAAASGTAAAPKPAAAAASSGDDDARLRALHAKLQQAKQQTKEANVSFEGLAKSIRATEAKLREQHKNRKIEFDVVIKDGKAVVKPIVR